MVVLLAQLLIPLRYYTSSDPFDERFAWRMFSGVRVTRCRSIAFEDGEDGRTVRITLTGSSKGPYGTLHPAWERLLERGRPAVIRKFLRSRCDHPGVARVRLANRCVLPSSPVAAPTPIDLAWTRDCQHDTTTEPSDTALQAARGLRSLGPQ